MKKKCLENCWTDSVLSETQWSIHIDNIKSAKTTQYYCTFEAYPRTDNESRPEMLH